MAHPKTKKERLDKLLLEKGLCETRTQAQGLILSGNVLINNQVADKPGQLYAETVEIRIKERLRYVSRGGLKLEKALQDFGVSIQDRVCMDVGASTGGFTDCLLQHGASCVFAIDVGTAQLDWALRQNPQVVSLEKTHILDVEADILNPRPTLAVIDVSFISIKKVIQKVASLLIPEDTETGEIIALVKPQFEYKDYFPLKGFNGVVTQPQAHFEILKAVAKSVLEILPDWYLQAVTESPIQGPKGNREFLFYLKQGLSTNLIETRLPEDFEMNLSQMIFKET